jgi:Ala-tRNA(Pro) deacylase
MGIAITLQQYLDDQGITYEVRKHPATASSSQTAQTCHISGHSIAKGVVVKDEQGFLLAVLPASHHIRFAELERCLHRQLRMASEEETGRLFSDCELGSIPAVGAAYGLETVVDDALDAREDVYFEAGDHQTLLRVKQQDFNSLVAGVPRAHFSHAS